MTDLSLEAEEARARIAFENPVSTPPLNFHTLRVQNVSRKIRWHGEADEWSGADWSNAMAGETGEACNIVKKLRRHETGIGAGPQAYPGMRDPSGSGMPYNTPPPDELLPALAEELADVVTYADLVAHKYGIDLGRAVREKFNRVSEAQGFPERL
jgi:NTP pyrophosphatase (non-canonical NTP hydrolase)